jgi:hypothetical protein
MSATTSLASLDSGEARGSRENRRFRLYVPLILLWLILLPLTPLLWLALLIVSIAGGVNPFRAVVAVFRTFASLRGTRVEFESCQISILVSLF